MIRRLISEFLGTAIIGAALIGATSTQQPAWIASLVVAGVWALMLLLFSAGEAVHLNPALSFFYIARSQLKAKPGMLIILVQIAGAVLGVWLGGFLYGHNWWQVSGHNISNGQLFSEALVTCVLLWLIGHLVASKRQPLVPVAVFAWMFVAGLFASSGAVANPALTIGRMFTSDSVAEIGVQQGATFILAQFAGVALALLGMMFITNPGLNKPKKKSKK